MPDLPELEDFAERLRQLRASDPLQSHINSAGDIYLSKLTVEEIKALADLDEGYYFLMAATGLNRTALKKAMESADLQVVKRESRRAQAIRNLLPTSRSFDEVARKAVAERRQHLSRRRRGSIEQLFRERLEEEGIPLAMSPPRRVVPGALIENRKPDGVYPDPATGESPRLYLEIKNIRRVRDDIQKRLYELAQASLEMKLLYGDLMFRGLASGVVLDGSTRPLAREKLRNMVQQSSPAVVGLFLCPRDQAERYRAGAEAFVDRLFFQEEVEECIAFIRRITDEA